MKKVFYLVVSLVVLFSTINLNTIEAAASAPKLKINNAPFVTPKDEPAPYINKDGRTMGSLRLVANAVGVSNSDIKWDADTTTATLTKGDRTVAVTLGKNEMLVNGKVVTMDTKAEMKQGRVFIPARFIAEGLGMYVGYISSLNTVLISDTPINEIPKHNIEETLKMEVLTDFPLKFNTEGINLTVHELYFIDVFSEEGKALNDTYDFAGVRTLKANPANEAYLVKAKVDIKNTGTKLLEYGMGSIVPFIQISVGGGYGLGPDYSYKEEVNTLNNTEFLRYISLNPGESISGTYYFYVTDRDGLEYLDLSVGRRDYQFIYIAEKR